MSILHRNKRIIVNTAFQIVSKIASVGLSIISVALLARYLGAEKYGWYTLVFTYVSFFTTLADIGYNQTIVREFSLDVKRSKEVFSTLFNLKLILTVLAMLAALIGLLFVPYSPDLKMAIVIGVVALAISNVSSYGTSILQSQLRLDLVAVLDLVVKGITVLLIAYFIHLQLSFYCIIYAILIGNLIGAVIEYFFIKEWIVFGLHFDKAVAQRIIKISVPVGITAVLTMVYFKIDTLMLSFMKTPADVGIYALAYKILDNIIMLWGLIMASIFPLLSKYHGKDDSNAYRILLKNTVIFSICLSLSIVILGNMLAPLVMRVLGGSKFYSSIEPFRILLWAVPFLFLDNIFFNIILSFGKTVYLIVPLLTSIVVTIVLNSVVIPTYGYIGASYVTVATECITSCIYLLLLLTKLKEERRFLTNTYAR